MQAGSLPAFEDTSDAHGVPLPFRRKAQLAAADLHLRFGGGDELFNFTDAAELAPDSGAYAAAQLRKRGCLQCDQALERIIADRSELPAGAQERILRAGAVVAGHQVAAAVGVEAWQLSRWMQHQIDMGREPGLMPHQTPATAAY